MSGAGGSAQRRSERLAATVLAAAALLSAGLAAPAAATAAGPVVDGSRVVDGKARFEVLTPTLIRLEYADDGAFEDRPSVIAINRSFQPARFTAQVNSGWLEIRTAKLLLRYREGSGQFAQDNLEVHLTLPSGPVVAKPQWGSGPAAPAPYAAPPNLGGWRRSLDNISGSVPLHEGLLSTDGWHLIDDSSTALLDGDWYSNRPARAGPYQDGYFFGYGHDYRQGLADLRALTGPATLLPRKAFGVWHSRYFAYSDSDLRGIVAKARQARMPLDMMTIDTDFKSPNAWNGWEWNPQFFPDPAGFLSWAHSQGLLVGLNVHSSIAPNDPKFPAALRTAGALLPCTNFGILFGAPGGVCWDWAQRAQVDSYFSLHKSLEDDGVDFWWLDWCCDQSTVSDPQLPADTWINSLYARRREQKGLRGFVLGRIGGKMLVTSETANGPSFDDGDLPGPWAEHRYSIHFTGDASSTWDALNFEIKLTPEEGNAGIPYVSDDIGGFNGTPSDELYVRWLELAAFQPVFRLHGNHSPRLPWEFPNVSGLATSIVRLRESLVPYTYSLARESYDTGLPMTRAMYLDYPDSRDAYSFADGQYLFGDRMLVAPVGTAGTPDASKRVWLPPGAWYDFFSGRPVRGGQVADLTVPLSRIPVFVRAGSIVPMQPYMDHVGQRPVDPLILKVFPGADGSFRLYEDAGEGLGYRSGEGAFTTFAYRERSRSKGRHVLTIGKAAGSYPGRLRRRRYEIQVPAGSAPKAVVLDGRALPRRASHGRGWSYARNGTLTIRTPALATGRRHTLEFGPARR